MILIILYIKFKMSCNENSDIWSLYDNISDTFSEESENYFKKII